MQKIFDQIIQQLNSSVIVLLGILLASYYAVHIVTKLVEKFSHHERKLGKVDDLSEKIVELKTKVDLIYLNTHPHKVVAAMSPISITPIGEAIASKINAPALFEKYASELMKCVEEKNPKNPYDIQVTSMAVAKERMLQLLDATEINRIKEEAFQKGLLLEDIMALFGVFLRDRILLGRGIAISEVDQHSSVA